MICVFYLQWCWASCLRQLRDWSELRKDRDTLVAVFVPSSGHQDIAPHWPGLVISTLRACQVFSRALITHGHIGAIIGTTSFLVFIHNSKPSVPTLNWLELAAVSYGNKMEYFHLHQFCDSNARLRPCRRHSDLLIIRSHGLDLINVSLQLSIIQFHEEKAHYFPQWFLFSSMFCSVWSPVIVLMSRFVFSQRLWAASD